MSVKKWRAFDHCNNIRFNNEVLQEANQAAFTEQKSFEKIIVKDSEGVTVRTTDTQVAVSIQAALQVAIAVVIRITIGDNDEGEAIIQDLKQFASIKQKNAQKTIIENSTNVEVTTTDTDIAVNLQVLLQILVAILVSLDIL